MKRAFSFLLVALVIIGTFGMVRAASGDPVQVTPPTRDITGGVAGKILGYIQWVGYAIAIGMLIYIGIKYTMASASEKADLKGYMIKYVIGAVLISGAVTIAGWFRGIL